MKLRARIIRCTNLVDFLSTVATERWTRKQAGEFSFQLSELFTLLWRIRRKLETLSIQKNSFQNSVIESLSVVRLACFLVVNSPQIFTQTAQTSADRFDWLFSQRDVMRITTLITSWMRRFQFKCSIRALYKIKTNKKYRTESTFIFITNQYSFRACGW